MRTGRTVVLWLAPQPRKSIGAQVYYGVRLDGEHDAEKFLDDLAGDQPCFHTLAFRWCYHWCLAILRCWPLLRQSHGFLTEVYLIPNDCCALS